MFVRCEELESCDWRHHWRQRQSSRHCRRSSRIGSSLHHSFLQVEKRRWQTHLSAHFSLLHSSSNQACACNAVLIHKARTWRQNQCQQDWYIFFFKKKNSFFLIFFDYSSIYLAFFFWYLVEIQNSDLLTDEWILESKCLFWWFEIANCVCFDLIFRKSNKNITFISFLCINFFF